MIASSAATPDQPTAQTLRVALVQPVPEWDLGNSLEQGETYCRTAKAQGADIVLFPEMFSLGYKTAIDFKNDAEVQAWKALALETSSPYVRHFQQLAKELDMAIVITYLERRGSELRNAATLFDRHGTHVYTYNKVHTCTFFPMEGSLAAEDDFYVAELDTRAGPVQVGVMTCYDREFPESARVLMLKGVLTFRRRPGTLPAGRRFRQKKQPLTRQIGATGFTIRHPAAPWNLFRY